ncbi:MAG: hypothetical protein HUU55_24025 [Myxococcales bacterium]|nr:hypothetical protein [Myxococcales bacterium]
MQLPSPKVDSGTLYKLGLYYCAAVSRHPETAALSAPFMEINTALRAAQRAREDADLELIPVRVGVQFSEYELENAIRNTAITAHRIDGNMRSGPVFDRVFPNNLHGEVAPRGAAQVVSGQGLLLRLSTSTIAAPVFAEHGEELKSRLETLKTALAARKQAAEKLALARAQEWNVREDWVTAYHHNAGIIKSLFPRNSDRQNLYFDEFRKSSVSLSVEEDRELTQLLHPDESATPAD